MDKREVGVVGRKGRLWVWVVAGVGVRRVMMRRTGRSAGVMEVGRKGRLGVWLVVGI